MLQAAAHRAGQARRRADTHRWRDDAGAAAVRCPTTRHAEGGHDRCDRAAACVWFVIIGFGVMMYVLLDGFVLGIGILTPFAEDEHQRDHMMNTAAPIWDGNETWLVLGGAGLLAAFPKAYAIVLSALYLPVLLMLIALIFRGVAFEFRFKAHALEAGVGRGVRARVRCSPRSRRA